MFGPVQHGRLQELDQYFVKKGLNFQVKISLRHVAGNFSNSLEKNGYFDAIWMTFERFVDPQVCPWQWDSHGNPMENVPWDGWVGTARIAFFMKDNKF